LRRSHLFALLPTAALALATSPVSAEPPHGLYVTEPVTGSVASILSGGDFTGVVRFATGLTNPSGICIGPGNQLYVTEFDTGEITVVDPGGDLTNKSPFAFGLEGPSALYCTKTQIWVAEYDSGEVTDITAGGNGMIANHANSLPKVLGLLRDSMDVLWSAQPTGVTNITAPGSYGAVAKHATGQAGGIAQLLGQHLVTDVMAGAVLDWLPGGDFTQLPTFATGLETPAGILPTEVGLFVASPATGEVFDVTGGGDFSAAAPFASGLSNPTALAYWAGCGDTLVGVGEDCDTGPASATCDEDCTAPVCGDWTLNAAAGEQCDDGNGTDGDGCTATCQKEASGSGGAGGGGGAGGNGGTSAGGNGGTGVGGAGGDGGAPRASSSSGTGNTGNGPVTEPVPANGAGQSTSGTGGSANEPDGEDDGCSCRGAGAPAAGTPVWLAAAVALLATARRRRRR
jgi:MYXO-CTERM domain-containing protein